MTTTRVTLNGNDYSTDGTTDRDLRGPDGYGHRRWLLAMLSDAVSDVADKLASALGYRNESQAARDVAVSSKSTAVAAAMDASADRARAESARVAAEAARDQAEAVAESVADGPVVSVNGHHGVVTLSAADVGLTRVDNTADVDKPVSTATREYVDQNKTTLATIQAAALSF